MARKKTAKKIAKTSKKQTKARKTGSKSAKPAVKTYKDSSEPEKKPSKGYINHPWHKLAAAAIVGALLGWLLRRRK